MVEQKGKDSDFREITGEETLPDTEVISTVGAEDATEVGSSSGKAKKGKKGKRGGPKTKTTTKETRDIKFSYDIDSPDMRNAMRCSNCGNLMTQSKKVNKFILDDKEMRKGPDQKSYSSKSPGAPEGKYMSPLCDDCNTGKEKGAPVDFKTAVVIRSSGEVANIPVAELDAT